MMTQALLAVYPDKVRAIYPGYSGYRPRAQLFHGDADALEVNEASPA